MGTLSRSDSKNRFQFGSLYDHHGFNNIPQINHQKGSSNDQTPLVECDYFGGVYDYIKKMLMEEDDLDQRPCMFQDCSALQAAERYFYDAIQSTEKDTCAPLDHNIKPSTVVVNHNNLGINRSASGFSQWSSVLDSPMCPSFSCEFDGLMDYPCNGFIYRPSQDQVVEESNNFIQHTDRLIMDTNNDNSKNNNHHVFYLKERNDQEIVASGSNDNIPPREDSRRLKTRTREENGINGTISDERNNKQLALHTEEYMDMDKYDKSLLCPKMNPRFYDNSSGNNLDETSGSEDDANNLYRKSTEVKRGRPRGSTKNRKTKEVVDLMSLLTRCAQAVSNFNTKASEELLKQIREYSSPHGDENERLAHYFAQALEARIAGTGSAMYTSFALKRISASGFLKSYQAYVSACPFKRMSNIFANKTIGRYTREADKVHIIDFGILYGFQWPCIIQGLSLRPGGPPMLKITGIDFPQPGFKPIERVEQTGARLIEYCKRFSVPFEYNAIAKKWDEIDLNDLKIERDEMVVVNCLYRMRHVPDESACVESSPRDAVLKFIRKINPHLFVHGVVNGSYNASFFGTRFREALYHYSSFFNMLEATLPREDEDRMLYEREIFGRDVMNVIACEGCERVERPESYKQWQVRIQRAGFKQLELNRDILNEVKIKVKSGYHSCFLLDEDSEWMIQGWKGRVMYALSCWKPSEQG